MRSPWWGPKACRGSNPTLFLFFRVFNMCYNEKLLYFKEDIIMEKTYSEWRKTEEYKAWERKQKRLNTFVYTPIRIVIFPIVLLVRLYKWAYHYDD